MKSGVNNYIDKDMLDIYSDYLISSFSYTTATGLSSILGNQISHDKITRFLRAREYPKFPAFRHYDARAYVI